MELTERTCRIGEIDVHFVEVGTGPLVLLLHGFPEFWYSWRHQLPALAAAGFRAVAPDLRGYNESSRTCGVGEYRVSKLVDDVAGLIRLFGDEPAYVVGHDWGGVIAWRLAALRPELVRKLVILNPPHPAAFRRELRRNPLQWVRSSYVVFFQLPWLPEAILRAGNFALLERAWRRRAMHGSALGDEDIRRYKAALSHGLTGPLNYYRAALRWPRDLYDEPQAVGLPTLVLWGDRDPFLSPRLARGLSRWVADLRVVHYAEAGHWVHQDMSEEVNRRLIEFFGDS